MCENEECEFPFSDSPHHVEEDGQLKFGTGSRSQPAIVGLQDDLCESMSKVESLLTNYRQNCGPGCGCNTSRSSFGLDNVSHHDHCFMELDNGYLHHEEFNFSSDAYAAIKFGKVIRSPSSGLLSFTDLDSEDGQVSARSNSDDEVLGLDSDAEMEAELPSKTTSDSSFRGNLQKVCEWDDMDAISASAQPVLE